MKRPAPVVPAHTVRFFGVGETCTDSDAGDLVLVRHNGFVAGAIRFFERLRVPNEYCWCNHSAIVLDGGHDAHVLSEGAKGATVAYLDEMGALEYAVVNFTMSSEQRKAVVEFTEWSLGLGYGFLSLPADAVNAMTGSELGLAIGNRMVCSTQACRALERAGLVPDRSPYAVTPAHLAQYSGASHG